MVYVNGGWMKEWLDGNSFAIGIGFVMSLGAVMIGRLPATGDPLESTIVLIIVFLGSIGVFLNGFRTWRKERLVRNTPTSTIQSMAMGPVEIKGSVVSNQDVLQAPFSGKQCVLYKYEVEEYRRQGKHGHDWVTVDSGRKGLSFLVDDGTGRVIVDPDGAELKMPKDTVCTVSAGDEPPEEIQAFRAENNQVDEQGSLDMGLFELPLGNRQRFSEWIVKPGEHVYVFGEAMERDGSRSSQNQANLIINERETTPMFLISDKSEKNLVSSLSWSSMLRVGGGATVGIGSYWYLLSFVGLL